MAPSNHVEESPERPSPTAPVRGSAGARGAETHDVSSTATPTNNSAQPIHKRVALRRWPTRAEASGHRRRQRAARRTWRRPRLDLAAWFWRPAHVALERSQRHDRFWQRVQLELEKARRHDRRFVLARLRFDSDTSSAEQLDAELTQRLRYEDAVLVADRYPDEVLVLLAECEALAARCVFDRLGRQHATYRLRAVAVVVFPADGLTRDALVEALYAHNAASAGGSDAPRRSVWTESDLVTGG